MTPDLLMEQASHPTDGFGLYISLHKLVGLFKCSFNSVNLVPHLHHTAQPNIAHCLYSSTQKIVVRTVFSAQHT